MLTQLDEQQGRLHLKVHRDTGADVTDELIAKRPDFQSAINFCIEVSGLNDNQVAAEIGMQEAQFCRCRKGSANFPPNKIDEIEDVCGNEIPTRWKAMRRGYGLVRLKSAVEAELEAEKEKTAELEMKLKHFEEFSSLGGGK